MGYVGLPLAIEFVTAGFQTWGIDLSQQKVKLLRQGKSYIQDIPSTRVQNAVNSGKFHPTTDSGILSETDTVIVCVPTPIKNNQEPDLSYIQLSVDMIKLHLHDNMLIILESTTFPGTTEEFFEKEFSKLGYSAGKDYYLCYSPERIDPGNKKFNLRNTPKVIGGTTGACAAVGSLLYETILDRVVLVSTPKAAEMTKLLENTFRSVNIGFINEMARLSEELGVNIWEVIDAAATKPFGFMPFFPGPGIGGHCIPLDPLYLSWKAKKSNFYSKYIELAQEVNKTMPRIVINKMMDILNESGMSMKNSKILLLGMAYKPDLDDIRESPNLDVFNLLVMKGAKVDYHDFFVKSFVDDKGNRRNSIKNITKRNLKGYDCVVILTRHSHYDFPLIVESSKVVFDCRNATKGLAEGNIYKLGSGRVENIGI
ncbi:nucleotide sugar dehydrogenase [Paenibacillus sp. sptzw28]|nr:nucleotide sugar dehydrogenase [Paenibacillus sp. sptzw28]